MKDIESLKTIRFIDSDYRTLFTIPDGEKITLTFLDGETVSRRCAYLDEYHTQIGTTVYHICEFAERMERIGAVYMPEKPLALPEVCHGILPSTGALIRIDRGVEGYSVLPYSTSNPAENRRLADEKNRRMGVFPQQEAAMLGGALFGWDTPAAQAASYNMHGEPIRPLAHGKSREEKSIKTATKHALTEKESENRFFNSSDDAFAIYQLKGGEETRALRFEPLERALASGQTVDRTNYALVYTAPLPKETDAAQDALLESLYNRFNAHHPKDFAGRSLSVSDVIVLRQRGQVSCHYIDPLDFKELPGFLNLESPLKNAEMAMEDDYGMIDGIINNGKNSALDEKRPSVLERLCDRTQEKHDDRKDARKRAEQER